MACTLPKIIGLYEWYERNFGAFCRVHDSAYRYKTMSKGRADLILSQRIWNRGYPVFSLLTYVFTSTIGWYYWWRAHESA